MDRRIALHFGRILLPHRIGRAVARRLHHVHRGRLPRVGLTGFAGFVKTTDRQNACMRISPTFGVNFFGFALNAGHADA